MTIVNPHFDTPAESSNSYNYVTVLSTIIGWSFSGTAYGTMIINGFSAYNDATTPSGTTQALTIQMKANNGVYTASQSLSLTSGTCVVQFYARPKPDTPFYSYYSVGQQITASLNNATVTTSLSQTDDWVLYSLSVVITTGGVYSLSFKFTTINTDCTTSIFGTYGTDTSISLTGISMTQF